MHEAAPTDPAGFERDRLDDLIKQYLEFETIQSHKDAIRDLASTNQRDVLQKLIGKRLLFGTAGIRGAMGPGFGQMNDLVIIQTSQGLASYIVESLGESVAQRRGVIIGNDARHNSARFARLAALAFLQRSIPVYFCHEIVATPMVAFGVTQFDCCAGIVITASHNPKNDNGYKVYWSNGAQILSPHDHLIQGHIMRAQNQRPWLRAWDADSLFSGNQIVAGQEPRPSDEWRDKLYMAYDDLVEHYFAYLNTEIIGSHKSVNQSAASVRIAYTSMHGVAHKFITRALHIAGFPHIYPVDEQMVPDPEFPTVKFPNPEEAGALDLAFATAARNKCTLVLANDPDADRCAAAEYKPDASFDKRRVFTGNEIGALLGWWAWHCHQQEPADENKHNARDCYMISTAVSSKFLASMARIEGFQFAETLTGFKHMGNLADKLKADNKHVLLAFEEAIGYMCNVRILDKDGISACVQLAQCAAHLAMNYEGRSLAQQLECMYARYGYHYNINSYYLCYEPQTIKTIFERIQSTDDKDSILQRRTFSGPSNDELFRVKRVRDLNSGYDDGTPSRKPELPCSNGSYMVTFFIDDDITITLRTSGTEPKIKYYSEIVAELPKSVDESDIEQAKLNARNRLSMLVEAVIRDCLQPEKYNLKRAS